MKHSYIQHTAFTLFFLCVLSLALSVHAEESASQTPEASSDRENRQELRTERRGEMGRVSNERIINLSRNITNRLTSALTRMEKISARIETRIAKMKSEGTDVSEGEAKLAEAMSLIATTQAALATATGGETALTSDDPKESFRALRAQYMSIRDSIKQIHALLKESVSLLRGAGKNGLPETQDGGNTASSSPTE
jgi:Mg2+ and Co2+ transporter CorA